MIIISEDGTRFYMDGYLAEILFNMRKYVLERGGEMWGLITGKEGCGKSRFASHIAKYLDESFCNPKNDLSRIVYNTASFRQAILDAKEGQVIIYDEGLNTFAGRDVLAKENREMLKMMYRTRLKHLFVLIVAPNFFDFNTAMALHKTWWLIDCYFGKNRERGFFKFYDGDRKVWLWRQGKKHYDIASVKPLFRGRFTNASVWDEDAYLKKKLVSLEEDFGMQVKVEKN